MEDARGIARGQCKKCPSCVRYTPPDGGLKCSHCGCPPAGHSKLDQSSSMFVPCAELISIDDVIAEEVSTPAVTETSVQISDTVMTPPDRSVVDVCTPEPTSMVMGSVCGYPNCTEIADFDMNSGIESFYCRYHKTVNDEMFVEDIEDNQFVYGFDAPYDEGDEDCIMLPAAAQMPKDDSLCMIPECFQPKYVEKSGLVHDYCGKTHAKEAKMRGLWSNSQDDQMDAGLTTLMSPPVPAQASPVPAQASPGLPNKCAIDECPNTCHIDESGTVYECCGYTHAMEHQRRQALWQQVNQQVVKGITHCLLPNCNKHTWPFENYCGKTHATLGLQQGLVAPPPPGSQTGPKDSSLCIIPGCQKPKFVDSSTGATHDYCGKSHAEEGKKRGIYATADKVEEQCDLPGCTNKKKTEGGTVYDYCCRDHAQRDAPNRDARILTTMPEVQKFLKKFSNLTVVSMKENDYAKPGGVLFNKFKNAMMSLPNNQRNTCLAFHGTAERNIDSICSTGYDSKRRCGQAHGAGEYFATSPSTPLGYCKGGKKLLLNELLLGQSGTHHTKHGDIVVMKNPDHDLPRFVITFK